MGMEDDKLTTLALSQQAQLADTIKEHSKVLKEQNETLIRNTITIEEHDRRATASKEKINKVSDEFEAEIKRLDAKVDQLETYVTELKGVGKMFKGVSFVLGLALAALALLKYMEKV